MIKVQNGDLDKLGLLYERYKGLLFGYFYNMSGDSAQSEDLVQGVFIRIIKYKNSFKNTGPFKIWMMHIARNVNIDHYRKESKMQMNDIEKGERETESSLNWVEEKVQSDELKMLALALDRIDDDKREVISLSKLQGMKYNDIGLLLDCSENAVKTKVFRAVKALREEFQRVQKLV